MPPSKAHTEGIVTDQISGAFVNSINAAREHAQDAALSAQDNAFSLAMEQIDNVRDAISDESAILGSVQTKHGEIAEFVEVGVSRAKQALNQEAFSEKDFKATFAGVGRTAPADYKVDGIDVQSKFINGANNNLEHVIKHMEKYPDFGRDDSYYHIPKDSHETIKKIINGEETDGLSNRTIEAIKAKVAKIETLSGKPFDEAVKPGVSNYSEVQLGKIDETLQQHEQDLSDTNDIKKEEIIREHGPSLEEAGQAALIGGAVGGAISLTTAIYGKYREGKNPFKGNFNAQDWQDVGIETAKGTAIGGVSAAAIYGLTNYAGMAAPFAGAVVSATKGVSALANQYRAGEISFDDFCNLGLVVCSESAIVGICTAAGQTLIPVPILGAVIGSIAGKMLVEGTKSLGAKAEAKLKAEMQAFTAKLDRVYQQIIEQINAEFDKLGDLTKAAFDIENNQRLLPASVSLAEAHGVASEKIIRNHDDLDAFMLG